MKIKELINIREGNSTEYTFVTGEDCLEELKEILDPVLIISDKTELIKKYSDFYKQKIETKLFSQEKMSEISNTKSFSGVCIIGRIKKKRMPLSGLFVILDCIQDPGNLGNIFRSCASHNVAGLILSDDCCHINKQKIIRASRGLCFKVPSIRLNKNVLYNSLNPKNTWLSLKTDTDFKDSCRNISNLKTAFVVFGNEGKGISSKWNKNCNKIWIPCLIESLNVGSACSIILNRIKAP